MNWNFMKLIFSYLDKVHEGWQAEMDDVLWL